MPTPSTSGLPRRAPIKHAGHIRMNDGDAIGADHLAQRFPHGLDKRGLRFFLAAVEGRADQVGENLGVGLGLENMAFLFELGPEREVVFDDAVVHKHEAPAVVEMRMSVLVGDAAMGGPARMTDAKLAVRRTCRDDLRQDPRCVRQSCALRCLRR